MASTLTTDISSNLSTVRSTSPVACGEHKSGVFARLLQRLIDARQKQVDRELARMNSLYGSLR